MENTFMSLPPSIINFEKFLSKHWEQQDVAHFQEIQNSRVIKSSFLNEAYITTTNASLAIYWLLLTLLGVFSIQFQKGTILTVLSFFVIGCLVWIHFEYKFRQKAINKLKEINDLVINYNIEYANKLIPYIDEYIQENWYQDREMKDKLTDVTKSYENGLIAAFLSFNNDKLEHIKVMNDEGKIISENLNKWRKRLDGMLKIFLIWLWIIITHKMFLNLFFEVRKYIKVFINQICPCLLN